MDSNEIDEASTETDIIGDEKDYTEYSEQLDVTSKEVLKSTLMNLIAMRDNINHQIDELIKLL